MADRLYQLLYRHHRPGRHSQETFIHSLILAVTLVLGIGTVQAVGGSCTARAAEKKLAGAAKTSFLTKCEKDVKAACEAQATEKKLAGAARTSFVGKCTRDAVGG